MAEQFTVGDGHGGNGHGTTAVAQRPAGGTDPRELGEIVSTLTEVGETSSTPRCGWRSSARRRKR